MVSNSASLRAVESPMRARAPVRAQHESAKPGAGSGDATAHFAVAGAEGGIEPSCLRSSHRFDIVHKPNIVISL